MDRVYIKEVRGPGGNFAPVIKLETIIHLPRVGEIIAWDSKDFEVKRVIHDFDTRIITIHVKRV